MKPLGSVVLPIVFSLCLASCGGGGGDSSSDDAGGSPPAVNTAPTISEFDASPPNIRTNESVLYNWTIADNDIASLTCAVDVDSDGEADIELSSCDATGSVSYTFDSVGSFTSTLMVTDVSGLTTIASTVVAVSPASGSVPVIDSLTVSESQAITGTPVTISWVIDAAGATTLSCELDAEGDGTTDYEINPCPLSGSQSHTFVAAADVDPRLTVTTVDGASATQSTSLIVQGDDSPADLNRPPIVTAFNAAPGAVMIDQAVTFSWELSDPDGDSLTCDIDTDGNGQADITVENCNTGQSVEHFYLVPQRYEPDLTVRDPEGLEAQLDTAITVLPLQVSLAVAETAVAGELTRYEFTVSNVSMVPVTGVRVLFRVPAGVSFSRGSGAIPAAANCGSTCAEGAEATWSFASIPAGASRAIVVNALVSDSNASGVTISNRLAVTADAFTETISIDETIVVENQPSAGIVVSAQQDPVQPGEKFIVLFDIGNISTGNIGDVIVRSKLPRDVTVDSISDGGQLDDTNGEVIWNLSQLAVLNTRQLSMELSVPPTAVAGQIYAVQAIVGQFGAEPAAGMTDIVTVVNQRAPLQFDISTMSVPVSAGSSVNYQLTLSNVGLVPITNPVVRLLVPANLVFGRSSDAEPDAAGCGSSCLQGAIAEWGFNSLPAGSSETITINATVADSLQAGSLIEALFHINSASAQNVSTKRSAAGIDNNSASQLAVSASADPVVAGQEFVVTIDVGNISSGNLESAEVTLEIPDGVTVGSISGAGVLSGEDGVIRWPAQTLPVLDTMQYSATITAPGDAASGDALAFRSTLIHDGGLVVDGRAGQVVTVAASEPALQLQVVPAAQTVPGGGRLRYDIRVTNNALIPVQNTAVVYRVPASVSFARSTDADPDALNCGSTCLAGDEAGWFFPSIQPGETVTISVNTNVSDQLQAGSLINSVVEVRSNGLTDTIHLSNVVTVN